MSSFASASSAAAHLRARYPNAVDELLAGTDHYLVDATSPPGDPHTLVERTVDYLWQFRDLCDDPLRLQPGKAFADILDNRVPGAGAGDRWRRLHQKAAGSAEQSEPAP